MIAAVTFAVLSIPGNQLHGLLFGAEEEPIGWLADALKDGSIVLVASLVALVPVALLGARASRFAESRPDGVRASRPASTSLVGTSTVPSLAAPAPSGDDL